MVKLLCQFKNHFSTTKFRSVQAYICRIGQKQLIVNVMPIKNWGGGRRVVKKKKDDKKGDSRPNIPGKYKGISPKNAISKYFAYMYLLIADSLGRR